MNAWGITLLWTAVQVGVLLAAGTGVYLAVRRGNPAAGAWAIAAVLIAAISLSGFALSPWPQWWSIDEVWSPRSAPQSVATTSLQESASDGAVLEGAAKRNVDLVPSQTSDAGLSVAWREFLAGFQQGLEREEQSRAWRWPAWLAVAVLVGIALGLMRLGVALFAVHRFRGRAVRVDDAEARALLAETKQQLGCARRIELHESAGLGSPCTLGWVRPIVILPSDWRSWNESELRSVLAHEVAHVARGDFAVGILSQIGVALHFYNPLVWWLLGRLRLEQEMAADLCGAYLAGGREAYLMTLARMALRQSDLPLAARPFLPARGTLLRRVEMLHRQTLLPEGSISWSGRIAVAALLLFAGGLLAGVREPGESIANAAPPEKPTEAVATSESDEISAIVKASDPRLELEQLNSQYKKLDEFIRKNPDRVTPEVKLAHRYVAQRLRSAAMDFTHYQELLLAGQLVEEEGKAKARKPKGDGGKVRDADIIREAWKASQERWEVIRREYANKRLPGKTHATAEEYTKARRELREAELKRVDAESDAVALPAWKQLSPDERHAVARKAYLRSSSFDQLKRLGIAFHSFHDVHKRFPAAAEMGPDGKTPHSWRVALLPYLNANGEELYKRYRLDEPWDSEHNKQLIAEGAHFYNVPTESPSEDCGYFVFTGPGTVFDLAAPASTLRSITDGTAFTIGVVEAIRSVPWTKPEDLPFSSTEALPKLGGNFQGGFTSMFVDGSAHFIPADIDESALRALITKAGGERLEFDKDGIHLAR